jgi:hypothetical protein
MMLTVAVGCCQDDNALAANDVLIEATMDHGNVDGTVAPTDVGNQADICITNVCYAVSRML